MGTHPSQKSQPNNEQSQSDETFMDQLLKQLPKETRLGSEMVNYQGFWIWTFRLRSILSFQAHFQAQSTDIFINGMPKTGNTWLKSLVFATLYRHNHHISNSPLLHHNSHHLVPHLEILTYADDSEPDLDNVLRFKGSPRLLSTHLPFQSLPQSVKDLGCRVIYICRNPLDTLVSSYFFTMKILEKMKVKFPTMEEYFELYIQGITPYGPFLEHVLGYWKKRIEMPDKVLFIKYEELLADTTSQLKRIAEFIDQPFSLEEEQDGVIEEIIKLCSIKNLRELKVNQEGLYQQIGNHLFFRNGEVGDSANHLTPSMIDRMNELMHQKLDGSDLKF